MSFRNTRAPKTRRSASLRNNNNTTVPGLASYNRPRSLSFISTQTKPYTHYTSTPNFQTATNYNNFTPPYKNNIYSKDYLSEYGYKNNGYNKLSSYNDYNKLSYDYNKPSYNDYNYNKLNYNDYKSDNAYPKIKPTSYGGLSNGYGSLTVQSKSLSALNIMPYSTLSYDKSNRDYLKSVNDLSGWNGTDYSRENEREKRGRESRSKSRNGSFNRSRSQSSVRDSGMGSRSLSLSSLNSEGYTSGSESRATTRTPRIGSSSDLSALRGENGELDYKKMYEQAVLENDRLREKLRKNEDDLRETKGTLEKINTVTSKNSLSELEKRERRAMERKLSEMEEELKQLQKLKAENERLRAENRALTRVVSKLTNSTAK